MNRIHPPPLLRLILLGFLIVSLPLIGAIITAIAQVDRLAEETGRALVTVQNNTRKSSLLIERVVEMERSARQYQALQDESYKNLYNEHRREVLLLFGDLNAVDQAQNTEVRMATAMGFEAEAHRLVELIGTDADRAAEARALEDAFTQLRGAVSFIALQYNSATRELSNSMPEEALRLQRLLAGQAALVIPLSVGLAMLFVFFIARPLRQINQAIRSLGHGALGEPVAVKGTRDLEELGRQLELLRIRLIELEAQKVHFLRNVSHELKTPLTNIREAAELLFQANHQAAEQRTITSILRENSVRLQRMIEELLHFGADGDMTTLHMDESVLFDQIIRDALAKHAFAVVTRAIKLNTDLTPVTVTADTKRLTIIVDNLLSNAVKYSPTGGQIDIRLRCSNDQVTLDVCDTGMGISESEKPHLFEWFFTGSRPPESILVGTGMGLAIAQEYAIQQGGKISLIESVQGAHFRLSLRKYHEDVC